MTADATGPDVTDVPDAQLAEAASCQRVAERVRQTHAFRARNGYLTCDYDDDDVLAVLDNREQWRNLAYSRSADRDALAARVAELERAVRQLRAGAPRPWRQDLRTPVGRFENFINATRNYDSDWLGGIFRGAGAEATIDLGTLRGVLDHVAELETERDAAPPPAADDAEREAVGRLTAMLARLDTFGAAFPYRCGSSQVVLGEILSVSVDCENGHSEPVGAGDATGEDLRAALKRLQRLEQELADAVELLPDTEQEDFDTHAVGRVLSAVQEVCPVSPRSDALDELAGAATELGDRFATRITNLATRDKAGTA